MAAGTAQNSTAGSVKKDKPESDEMAKAKEEGKENACFVICDDMGVCDTTYIEVDVRSPQTLAAPLAIIDTIVTIESTPVVIDVVNKCNN